MVFWGLAIFFGLASSGYVVWGLIYLGEIEWAGGVPFGLCTVLFIFIAAYLQLVHRAQGGELPEDIPSANIDDGDPEIGFFSPWSWWPIALAGASAVVFLGIAIGFWLSYIGIALFLITIVGWVYEYYRGFFAR